VADLGRSLLYPVVLSLGLHSDRSPGHPPPTLSLSRPPSHEQAAKKSHSKYTIITKAHPSQPKGLSPAGIRDQLTASLTALKVNPYCCNCQQLTLRQSTTPLAPTHRKHDSCSCTALLCSDTGVILRILPYVVVRVANSREHTTHSTHTHTHTRADTNTHTLDTLADRQDSGAVPSPTRHGQSPDRLTQVHVRAHRRG
jgi:hypothetical protein